MTYYIISQVLAFSGTAIDMFGRTRNTKIAVLLYNAFAQLLAVLSYLFLQTWLPFWANAINATRCYIYIYLDRRHKSLWYYLPVMTITILLMGLVLYLFWQEPLDLFLFVSVTLLAICFMVKNLLIVRIFLIINSILWAIYNFTIHAYVNMGCDILNILIVVGAIITYNIVKPHQKRIAPQTDVTNNSDALN